MSPRVCVNIDGMLVQFARKPTADEIAKAREDLALLRSKLPPLTPEQIERQDAARARSRERLERIRREGA